MDGHLDEAKEIFISQVIYELCWERTQSLQKCGKSIYKDGWKERGEKPKMAVSLGHSLEMG